VKLLPSRLLRGRSGTRSLEIATDHIFCVRICVRPTWLFALGGVLLLSVIHTLDVNFEVGSAPNMQSETGASTGMCCAASQMDSLDEIVVRAIRAFPLQVGRKAMAHNVISFPRCVSVGQIGASYGPVQKRRTVLLFFSRTRNSVCMYTWIIRLACYTPMVGR
jgi:hypothetical protein